MRQGCFRSAALVIGLLGIPSVVLQIVQAWPPGELQLKWFGVQLILTVVFVLYGLGLAYQSPSDKSADDPRQSDESDVEDG